MPRNDAPDETPSNPKQAARDMAGYGTKPPSTAKPTRPEHDSGSEGKAPVTPQRKPLRIATLSLVDPTPENVQTGQSIPTQLAKGTLVDKAGIRGETREPRGTRNKPEAAGDAPPQENAEACEGIKKLRERRSKLAVIDDVLSRAGTLSPHEPRQVVRDRLDSTHQDDQGTGHRAANEKAVNPRQPPRRDVPPQPCREGHRVNLPTRPLESAATDYVGQAGTWHLTRNKRSVWLEAIATPPVPEHPRLENSATPPRGRAARPSTPTTSPSDDGLEFAPRATVNSPAKYGMQHGPSNNVDIGEDGPPHKDRPAAALMTSRNTPGQRLKALPAGVATRRQPEKTPLRIPTDAEATDNLATSVRGIDSRPKEGMTVRERYRNDGRDPPATKARLLPPITYTRVLTNSQTGKATSCGDETSKATETPPVNQDAVKVNDPTGPAKSGGELPGPRPLHSLEKGSDGESDSAWGARGHGEWSADPTIESGKAVSGKRTGAGAATEETPRRDASKTPRRGSTGTTHREARGEKQSSPSSPRADNEPDQADT